ncbi:MAG: class I SAM-dependent methyltransferase [Candidatus Thorarchaeota archaeon]
MSLHIIDINIMVKPRLSYERFNLLLLVNALPDKSIDYDSVSKIYDQLRSGEPEMIFHLLEEYLPESGSKVLDVGCGTGNNTLLLQKATEAQVFGLDSSFGMLLEAQEKGQHISFIHAYADSIPVKSHSFDMVFMTEVVHHLPSMDNAMLEMSRVLKTGGLLCIVTQSHRQIEERITSRFFPATVDIDKKRYPDIAEIEQCMKQKSFAKTWSRSYKFAPVILSEEFLDTVSRKGYSMLHKISENDYQKGLKALQQSYASQERLDYAAGYTYVWARKNVD